MKGSLARIAPGPVGAHYFQVGELVAYVRELFTSDPLLVDVWVSGEIADVSSSSAGHVYFTIRDADSHVPAVMFRSAVRRQTLPLAPGYQALVHGSVGLYEPRSQVQLVADIVLPGDAGKLRAEFEALRLRLEQEGLFRAERKRSVPRIPRRIGIVTSEAGAVLHDMMNVWRRRFPNLDLVLAPAAVQGEDAPRQIVAALGRLNEFHVARQPLDLIVVARGGGSPQELAVFNDERVARAIFASAVPVVSAIGHEVDVTIADLVADVRAPTPSAAAEMVTPDVEEIRRDLERMRGRLRAALERWVASTRAQVAATTRQLQRHAPTAVLADRRRAVDELGGRGGRAVTGLCSLARARVESGRGALAALSPLATLSRGYAICSRAEDGRVLTDAAEVSRGERLAVRLARGRVISEAQEVEPAREEP
jgi:exodeoxyribonuclease VII large subunit